MDEGANCEYVDVLMWLILMITNLYLQMTYSFFFPPLLNLVTATLDSKLWYQYYKLLWKYQSYGNNGAAVLLDKI